MGNLQVKNFPDDLHQQLRDRAKRRHMTVSAYVTAVLEEDIATMSMDEWLSEVRKLPRHDPINIEKIMDEVRSEIEGR